jgi:hypothetical protein
MKRIRLKVFEKSQNTEEYTRMLKVTGEQEGTYALPEQASAGIKAVTNEVRMEDLDHKVADDLRRSREYYRQERLQQVHEEIARRRGCI